MKATTHRLVWKRAGNRCEYCRLRQDNEPYYRFHVEHIIAKQHGGTDDPGNLALSCHHCNGFKGPNLSGIDRLTGNVARLFDPRRQRWKRHFLSEGAIIIGRTRCGRATMATLQMNQQSRVELRAGLIEAGLLD
jgi:hypothetical protein